MKWTSMPSVSFMTLKRVSCATSASAISVRALSLLDSRCHFSMRAGRRSVFDLSFSCLVS